MHAHFNILMLVRPIYSACCGLALMLLGSCAGRYPSDSSRVPVLAVPVAKGQGGLQLNAGLYNTLNASANTTTNPSIWVQAQGYYAFHSHFFVETALAGAYVHAEKLARYGGYLAPGVGFYANIQRLSFVVSGGLDLGTTSFNSGGISNTRYYGLYEKAGLSLALGSKKKTSLYVGLQVSEALRERRQQPNSYYWVNDPNDLTSPHDTYRITYSTPRKILAMPIFGLRIGETGKVSVNFQFMPAIVEYNTGLDAFPTEFKPYFGVGLNVPLGHKGI